MSGKLLGAVAAAIVAVLIGCAGTLGAILFGGAGDGTATVGCTAPAATPRPASVASAMAGLAPIGRWDSAQVTNAAAIIDTGAVLGVQTRGWVIAVAVAMQESALHNLPIRDDHDRGGLFAQRPSQDAGTAAEIMNPRQAATAFYQQLLTVGGWPDLPLAVAAQHVQHSAYPDAYAKWEPAAQQVVDSLSAGLADTLAADFAQRWAGCVDDAGDGLPDTLPEMPPPGYQLPPHTPATVVTAIGWALQQLGTPYSFGGDCTDPHAGNPAHQCDCSSLTQQAYQAAGITVPRIAADQSRTGRPVAVLTDLLPGDLLFIPGSDGTPDQPGHVGLYLGDGLLIQAPHSGDHIRLTRTATWTDAIVAIRRIVTPP
jgi:hypothetical protein